ncbi:MAG TPA: FAD-dependent oxidoreductase [Streptosporangiaceae bacterium]|nr:FAD-dependent oxidoreductase [Streptosporangiaceae bacterium]
MGVVIVGAGLAGWRTAEELRGRGYRGRIELIGAEQRPPYDRPPLSKTVLIETDPPDPSLRADFAAFDVAFTPGRTIASMDDLPDWDHLVIATGALPVALPGPGQQKFLRTYEDSLALRDTMKQGARLAIVGAGWIGAELATAAVRYGCAVTVVEAAATPLATALPADLGGLTAAWYEEAGIDLRTDTKVGSVEDGGLALADGSWLPADVVVTAVGVRPAIGWLNGSGIATSNGVDTDAGLRASKAGVYAVGDCAAFWSLRYGRRLRFEHWDVALHAPEVVAANVLGGDEAYDAVPYFWSEQFGRMLQYAGHHGDATRLLRRGSPAADEKWAVCWLNADSQLRAILTVGRPRDLVQGRRAIADGAPLDPDRLADPAVPVKEAVSRG